MKYSCYILYSKTLNRYYIGETTDIEARLEEHNSGFYKNAFTSNATDWEIKLVIPCIRRTHARKVEGFIKKMKSRKFIERLLNDQKLIDDVSVKNRS